MEKKIADLSIGELKSFAYDLILTREQATNQLQVVSQLIAQKSNSKIDKAPKPDKDVKKSK